MFVSLRDSTTKETCNVVFHWLKARLLSYFHCLPPNNNNHPKKQQQQQQKKQQQKKNNQQQEQQKWSQQDSG